MPSESMISPAQIRAARGLLDWSRQDLSAASGVGQSTIADYEKKRRPSILSENMRKIVAAFSEHGVEFTEADKEHGAGVRWRKP
jgi:transcriptional regulator with XRE-family HTH domain